MSEKLTPQTRTLASPIRSKGRFGFCFKPNVIISIVSLVGMALASLGGVSSSAQAQSKHAQPHRIIASRLTDRLIDEVDSPGGDHLILKPVAPPKNIGIAKTDINRANTKKKTRKAFRKSRRGTSKRPATKLTTKLKRRALKRAERKIRREKRKAERIAKAKRMAELRKRLARLDELQSDRLKKLYASRPVEFRPVPTLRAERHNHKERLAMALRNRPAITRYEAATKHPRPLKSSSKIAAREGLPQVIYGRRREKIARELTLKSNKSLVRMTGLTKKQKLAKLAVRKWAEGLYKKKQTEGLYKKKQTVGQYKKKQAKAAAPKTVALWRRKLSSLMH
jgi:hypothetical protein